MLDSVKPIVSIARAAGKLALKYYGHTSATLKDDLSYVTEADVAVEELIFRRLRAEFPGIPILGEEESQHDVEKARNAEYLWVVDPIDGTTVFSTRQPGWCTCIGLMRRGRPAAGCVFLPLRDEMFFCDIDGPALLNGTEIAVAHPAPIDLNSQMVVHSDIHLIYSLSFPGKVRSYGSTAYHLCLLAAGCYTNVVLAETSSVFVWDLAAALAVVERAGGELRTYGGTLPDISRMLDCMPGPQSLFAVPLGRFAELIDYFTPLA